MLNATVGTHFSLCLYLLHQNDLISYQKSAKLFCFIKANRSVIRTSLTWKKPCRRRWSILCASPPQIFRRFNTVLSVAAPIFGRFHAVLPVAASKIGFLSVIGSMDHWVFYMYVTIRVVLLSQNEPVSYQESVKLLRENYLSKYWAGIVHSLGKGVLPHNPRPGF